MSVFLDAGIDWGVRGKDGSKLQELEKNQGFVLDTLKSLDLRDNCSTVFFLKHVRNPKLAAKGGWQK